MSKIIDCSLKIVNNMVYQDTVVSNAYLPYIDHEFYRGKNAGPLREDEPISFALNYMSMVEHMGTHVDAFYHTNPEGASIDEMPLEMFFGKAVCFDLRHIPERGKITAAHMDEAEQNCGVKVDGHIVLLATGLHEKYYPDKKLITCVPEVTPEAVKWLADHGSRLHGVEGPSTDIMDEGVYPSHIACRKYGITHYEYLTNLPLLIGKGEFTFYGIPLLLNRGTGSPVRCFAVLDE